MRHSRIAAFVTLLAVGGVASTNTMAADTGAFVGAEIGTSELDLDVDGEGSGSDSDQSFVVRGGYYFTPNFAVEAFHAGLYDKSEDGASIDVDGIGLGLVGRHHLGDEGTGFFLLGRAGAFHAKGSASLEGFGSASDSTTVPYFGVGVGYDFTPNVGLGLNYTHYRGDFDGVDIDANTITAAVEYRF